MVTPAMEIARSLEQTGLSVAVINARFVKPLDTELICRYARSTKCLITLEEHSLKGGFGSAVLEEIHEHIPEHHVLVKLIGAADRVIEHGAPALVRKDLGLDAEGLLKTVQEFYNKTVLGAVAVSGNGKKAVHGNGRNKGNGSRKKFSSNGKKGQGKEKHPVNG